MTPLALLLLLDAYTKHDDKSGDNAQRQHSTLITEGLYQVVGENQVLVTPKGLAFIHLLCETPLPVQQWIDPRNLPTRPTEGQRQAVKAFMADSLAKPKRGRGRPRKLPIGPSQGDPIGTVDTLAPPKIPRGFTLWEPGPADATGKVAPPDFGIPSTAPQPEVSVIWRNGKRKTGPIQIFLWAQAGKPTDIVAYKQVGEPE